MATQIVEIPIHNIEADIDNESNKSISTDFEGFLSNEFGDYFAQDNIQNTSTTANVPDTLPPSNFIHRQDSNDSISSTSSFYGIDYDDYQQNLLYNDDFDSDFTSPFSTIDLSASPSMEDLSRNFNSLAKPNDEEVDLHRRGQKNEKVENPEEESSESSSSGSDSESVSDPETIKRELEKEGNLEGHSNDDPDATVKEEDDEEYRPVKKRIVGVNKNESFSSISSYSSGASGSDSEDPDEFEYEDDDEDHTARANYEPLTKKYKQPVSLRADNLKIGSWSLQELSSEISDDGIPTDITLDIKILFGRRKIKYEMCRPAKTAKAKTTLVIDFPFASISGLEFKHAEQIIVFQIADPPLFTRKEKGKCGRVDDFTNGNASTYQRHHIYVQSQVHFNEYMERLLSCDRRLRQLAKVGLSPVETTFPNPEIRSSTQVYCDWDKENKATKHCEECKSNYCDVCDDVLHRHSTHRLHNRIPVQVIVRPPPVPKPPKKVTTKKRKKMNNDRCRCGTGATKGTLGEPCTGNRCPCFSNGKSCVNCGCKNCSNPIRKSKPNGSSKLTSQEAIRV